MFFSVKIVTHRLERSIIGLIERKSNDGTLMRLDSKKTKTVVTEALYKTSYTCVLSETRSSSGRGVHKRSNLFSLAKTRRFVRRVV